MAGLTADEVRRLAGVRPELIAKVNQLMVQADGLLGLTLFVVPETGGLRSSATQQALYADSLQQGGGQQLAYPVASPGHSYHEYGAAADVDIVGGGSDADYRAVADLAQDLGLTAGYYFTKSDPYHVQLRESLAQVQDAWRKMNGSSGGATHVAAMALLLFAIGIAIARR